MEKTQYKPTQKTEEGIEVRPFYESGHKPLDNPTDLSPGSSDAHQKDSEELSHGQESFIGLRPNDPDNAPGSNPPRAGDTDTADTDSATATGQDGDLTDINKKKAYNYS